MLIQDLIALGQLIWKEREAGTLGKQFTFGSSKAGSIAARASENTYYFPIVMGDDHTMEEIVMIMRAAERSYALFTRSAFQLIPAIEVENFNDSTITDYLARFHVNMGMRNDIRVTYESACVSKDFNDAILNEAVNINVNRNGVSGVSVGTPGSAAGRTNNNNNNNQRRGNNNNGNGSMNMDGKTKLVNDSDWNKVNDLVPSTVLVPIKFVSKSVSNTVDVMVNIKSDVHKSSAIGVAKAISDTLIGKKTLMNFVKLVSGEDKSVTDFLFGISQMKEELTSKEKIPFLDAFKRRKRLAQLANGFIKNNLMPTGTLCITMNTVNILREKYDIDIFKESNKLMDAYFLLGLFITDQTNEVVYVKYDSQLEFQEYPYKTFEREGASQDRTIKDMIKAMGAFR